MSDYQPKFTKPLDNVTVPVGRDATFTCDVQDLGGYRVKFNLVVQSRSSFFSVFAFFTPSSIMPRSACVSV